MKEVSVTKTIDVPTQTAWATMSDFGGIYKFHPRVVVSPLLSENNSGLGAMRRCEFVDKTSVVEKVVGWEEGREMQIELSETSMPLTDILAILRVEDAGDNKSNITFYMRYTPRFGFIGSIMNAVMIKPMMKKVFVQLIDGVETHVKTGEVVGKDGKPTGNLAAA